VHCKKIYGDCLRHVVPNEGSLRLRRWPSSAHHVLGDRGLSDVVAKL
jgi:hypothetical protein